MTLRTCRDRSVGPNHLAGHKGPRLPDRRQRAAGALTEPRPRCNRASRSSDSVRPDESGPKHVTEIAEGLRNRSAAVAPLNDRIAMA